MILKLHPMTNVEVRQSLKRLVDKMIANHNGSTHVEQTFRQNVFANNAYDTIVESPKNTVRRGSWRSKMRQVYSEYIQHATDLYGMENSSNHEDVDLSLPAILLQVMEQVANQIKFLSVERFVIDLSKISHLHGVKNLCDSKLQGNADVKLGRLFGNTITKFLGELLVKQSNYKTFRNGSLMYVVLSVQPKIGFNTLIDEYDE